MGAKPSSPLRSLTICAVTAVLAIATYYLLPSDMNELARRTAAIFVVAAIFWATEALPLYATSLCIIGFEIVFLADKGGMADILPMHSAWPTNAAGQSIHLSYKSFLTSWSAPVIMLFMGGFLLSSAVSRHGLDRVIASKLLRPFSTSPTKLLFGILGITAFFSMWMSNTATAAMVLAIVAPVLAKLPRSDRFHRGAILAVPFGANIGGIGTPIGTPPNAVALGALRDAGYHIGFLEWMLMAVPLAVLLVIVTGVLLLWFYRPSKDIVLPEIEKAENLDGMGKLTLLILGLTILLWLTSKVTGISDAAVALLAAAALTALRVLDKKDVDNIDWNVLLLMWGGLSLGSAMQSTGLVDYLVESSVITNLYSLPGPWSGFLLACGVVTLTLGLGTFMSHTAATALLVPIVMGLAPGSPVQMVVLTALAASFAMAMPVSTPPNAIAFATGDIPAASMIRSGGLISIVACVVLLVGQGTIIPMMLSSPQVKRALTRRVAVIVPMTGAHADKGELQRNGYALAESQIRKMKIEVRYFDSADHGNKLAGFVESEVLPWMPDLIVGPYSSEEVASVGKMVGQTPVIVPTANVDELTQQSGRAIYRVSPPMQMIAMAAADFLKAVQTQMAFDSILILSEDSSYGKSAVASIMGNCIMRSLPTAKVVTFGNGQAHEAVFSVTPKTVVLMVTRHVPDAKALLERLADHPLRVGFAGAFATPALEVGDYYRVTQWGDDEDDPIAQQFVEQYQALYQSVPQYHAAQAYSALITAGNVLEQAVMQKVSVKKILGTQAVATPVGQVRFLDFAGYFNQNPTTAVVQQLIGGKAATIYPKDQMVMR